MKHVWILACVLSLTGCITVKESDNSDLKSDPVEMAESRIALGLGYLENGSMIKARENLEKAMQHAPHYYRSQLSMAHYFETVGETDSARDTYRAALRDHPKTVMCSTITAPFYANTANISRPISTLTALSNSLTIT